MTEITDKNVVWVPYLDGAALVESAISFPDTEKGMLFYRGYPIDILAEKASFEEVAYLILFGRLPTEKSLRSFQKEMKEKQYLPNGIINTIRTLKPEISLFNMTAIGVLSLAQYDNDLENTALEKNYERALLLISKFPIITANAVLAKTGAGQQFISSKLSPLSNFIDLLNIWMDEKMERAFEVGQILCCEHEMNASTLAVRTVASAGSNMYLAVLAGLSAFAGIYHGGASQFVVKMLKEIGSSDNVQKWVNQKLAAADKKDRIIMGFGHRIYKGAGSDPRTIILKRLAKNLIKDSKHQILFDTAKALEKYIGEKKNLCANVDFYFALVNHFIGFRAEISPLIYAMARIAGWTAHYIEQFHDPKGRILRPRAIYIGPKDQKWIDLENRK
jgi:citrate synthase